MTEINNIRTGGAVKRRVDVKEIAILAMLSAVAYVMLYISKLIPVQVSGFLNYDMKDVVIVIAGFIYGPVSAVVVSVVVSLIEMVTISDTGPVGLLMNVLSTCVFSCAAAMVYKKRHSQRGAVEGLVLGVVATTAVMILWNYLITPLYMHVPRDVVVSMLVPVFLPFNLIKYSINATFAVVIYKPLVKALRHARLLPESAGGAGSVAGGKTYVVLVAAALFVTCVLLGLVLAGVI